MFLIRLPVLLLLCHGTWAAAPSRAETPGHMAKTPHFSFNELYNLQIKLLDSYMYPNNTIQTKSINSSLLAPDVQGRTDITRTFEGAELNTEYIFGLFASLATNPNSLSLLGVPISYELLQFTANDYITSAATRIMFNFTSLGIVLPVEVDAWHTWNGNGQLTQYDASFKYWQWLVDTVITAAYVAPRSVWLDRYYYQF